jgi:hypothetical protein
MKDLGTSHSVAGPSRMTTWSWTYTSIEQDDLIRDFMSGFVPVSNSSTSWLLVFVQALAPYRRLLCRFRPCHLGSTNSKDPRVGIGPKKNSLAIGPPLRREGFKPHLLFANQSPFASVSRSTSSCVISPRGMEQPVIAWLPRWRRCRSQDIGTPREKTFTTESGRLVMVEQWRLLCR